MTDLSRGPSAAPEVPWTAEARHGRLPKAHGWKTVLAFVGAAMAVLLVSGASLGAIVTAQLASNVETFVLPGQTEGPPPSVGSYEGGFNILIVGSDRCEVEGGCEDREAELNDVTMLLHVSQDQTNAVAVSFPRDLMVEIPSCPRADGSGNNSAMSSQMINTTLSYGGVPCTVLTVEKLTGLDIQFAGLITFNGVIQMAEAVGGVDVCLTGPLNDPYVGLDLPAGINRLEGAQSLAFLRSRHGVGNGGDVTRISSQQVYLSSLVRTLQSAETLQNPLTVYSLARAATSNMLLSDNFASVDTLFSIASVLKDIPLENITFVQYPGFTDVPGPNSQRVLPDYEKAGLLFDAIAADQPFQLAQAGDGEGSILNPDAAPVVPEPVVPESETSPTAAPEVARPTFDLPGQTAADQTCTVTRP